MIALFLSLAALAFIFTFIAMIAELGSDELPLISAFLAIVFLVTALVFMFRSDAAKEQRIMDQCMQDHKEYECVAMLKSNEEVVPVPVVIPIH